MKKILPILFLLFSFAAVAQNTLSSIPPVVSGTDTYTVTVTGFPVSGGNAAILNRMFFARFTNANTGASTLVVNGLASAANIQKWDGSAWVAVEAGDIPAGSDLKLRWDGTRFQIQVQAGGGGSGGTIAPESGTGTATGTVTTDLASNDWDIINNDGHINISGTGDFNIDQGDEELHIGPTGGYIGQASTFTLRTPIATNRLTIEDDGSWNVGSSGNGANGQLFSSTGGTTDPGWQTRIEDVIVDGVTANAPAQNAVFDALAIKAPLASPTFTGTPAAPTASPGTSTTQLATTAFVQAALPTANNSIYFSPAQNFNPGFIVLASAIVRPSNAFSSGNPITYEILEHNSAHNSSFITSAEGASTTRLKINYPLVRYVINLTVTPDESYSGNNVICGPTVGLNNAEIAVGRPTHMSVRLTGAGTTTWTKSGTFASSFDLSAYSAGGTSFNLLNGFNVDYNAIQIQYIGPNNYGVRRVYSGLGAYNIRFVLVDRFTGTDLTTNPTSSDEVIISGAGMNTSTINMLTWNAANQFMAGPSSIYNFWIFGMFECWMVAAPASSTSIQVRWQTDYPSATDYKIYRDTDPNFGTQVLIHTGTEGTYTDTGLTTGTLYYYKLVGVISGVDTDITTFRAVPR